MGVSGSGKSTLALRLAQTLEGSFIEGDDHHPAQSWEKMRLGVSLSDSDREPWLDALSACLNASADSMILSCSALKRSYRARLRAGGDDLRFVFLDISLPEALERVSRRRGHDFPASLVADQFAALESPAGEDRVLCLPARSAVEDNLDKVLHWIGEPLERHGNRKS
jgi:gluconokinase